MTVRQAEWRVVGNKWGMGSGDVEGRAAPAGGQAPSGDPEKSPGLFRGGRAAVRLPTDFPFEDAGLGQAELSGE